jgi:divalent metal cation (Fe/Co/Zn/Cd) transporter
MLAQSRDTVKSLYLILGFSLASLGAVVKLVGASISSSKSLLVDALTCLANLVAGGLAIYYTLESLKPPDKDHPYGHGRLLVSGVIATLIAYAFVAGVIAAELLALEEYTVSYVAPVYALAGLILYAAAIAVLRRISYALAVYSILTTTELLESAVSLFASFGGAYYSYVVDYVGALALAGFLGFELYRQLREVLSVVADTAPPALLDQLSSFIRSLGVELCSLRLRVFVPGIVYGDAVIAIPPNKLSQAHEIADAIAREAESRFNVRLIVHYEPSSCAHT